MPDHPTDGLLARIASRSGELRRASSDEHKKQWSQYLTSPEIAGYMASLFELDDVGATCRILDPGAGTGILGLTLLRRVMRETDRSVQLLSVEPEPLAHASLKVALREARRLYGERLAADASAEDVLDLAEPRTSARRLPAFDLVIANPPYCKMPPADPRGGGAPNIYARFMYIALDSLRPGGQMCFIVPRSFTSGSYFRRFRQHLLSDAVLERVHLFDSRQDAFAADGVLQENIIVLLRKRAPGLREAPRITISVSAGTRDLVQARPISLPRVEVLRPNDPEAMIRLPTSLDDQRVGERMGRWPHRLIDLGLEVSTGPVVPFRCRELLSRGPGDPTKVPLLWLQHVHPTGVRWPLGDGFRKQEYIDRAAGPTLLVANGNYVLVRRFSAKEEQRRLTAACLLGEQLASPYIGVENHVNLIRRPSGILTSEEARGLAAILNSTLMDRYFRMVSGNTQVSATELRSLPMPDRARIVEIGRQIVRDGSDVDTVVLAVLADKI